MDNAFGKRRRRGRPLINITSLIDVMFLLLIFFMVSSTFRSDFGLEITLPEAVSAAGQPERAYTIHVESDGRISFDGDIVTPPALREMLGAIIEADPTTEVTLDADQGASWQMVVGVVDTARDAGVRNLIVATQPPDQR